jgi:hypothetical protein
LCVGAGTGHIASLGFFIEERQIDTRGLFVTAQIEVGAVVDAFEFFPAEGEFVFDIVGVFGVVRQFARTMLVEAQLLFADAEVVVEFEAHLLPVVEPLLVFLRIDEILHFHLLEFA